MTPLARVFALATLAVLTVNGFAQSAIGRSAAGEKAARERAVTALTGLHDVQVSVLYEMPQSGAQGIAGNLRDDFEAKLKKAGIATPMTREVSPDLPTLEIRVGLNTVGSLVNIEANLYEPVTIVRNGKKVRGISLHDEWLYTFDKRNDRPENDPHIQAIKAFNEVVDWLIARYTDSK